MSRRALVLVGLLVALVLAGGVSYCASSAPDGLNKVAGRPGLRQGRRGPPARRLAARGLRDATASATAGSPAAWRASSGVAVTFLLVGGLVWGVRRRTPRRTPPTRDARRAPRRRPTACPATAARSRPARERRPRARALPAAGHRGPPAAAAVQAGRRPDLRAWSWWPRRGTRSGRSASTRCCSPGSPPWPGSRPGPSCGGWWSRCRSCSSPSCCPFVAHGAAGRGARAVAERVGPARRLERAGQGHPRRRRLDPAGRDHRAAHPAARHRAAAAAAADGADHVVHAPLRRRGRRRDGPDAGRPRVARLPRPRHPAGQGRRALGRRAVHPLLRARRAGAPGHAQPRLHRHDAGDPRHRCRPRAVGHRRPPCRHWRRWCRWPRGRWEGDRRGPRPLRRRPAVAGGARPGLRLPGRPPGAVRGRPDAAAAASGSPCSAPTAPARRRWSCTSTASCSRATARSRSPGSRSSRTTTRRSGAGSASSSRTPTTSCSCRPSARTSRSARPTSGCAAPSSTRGSTRRSTRSGCSTSADRPPHHLSFGQRRRVAVATVLAMQPGDPGARRAVQQPRPGQPPRARRDPAPARDHHADGHPRPAVRPGALPARGDPRRGVDRRRRRRPATCSATTTCSGRTGSSCPSASTRTTSRP